MSKRKLTRRQQWRIEKIQQEKAARAEKKAKQAENQLEDEGLGSEDLGPERQGRLVSHFGQSVDVEPLDASYEEAPRFRCFVRANTETLVTGDHLVWREGKSSNGIVEARLERNSLLQRPDNHGQLKPVAANIDRIVVVIATEPTPHANFIDRYIVAAETIGIKPAILFNKQDLIGDAQRTEIEELTKRYTDLGYEVLFTSALDEKQCQDQLADWLANFTSIFVGQSGVGKSSLIRSILGDQSIRVGALSEATRKGTHTTTTARLFHLPEGGMLIDSPGIREFALWHITEQELLEGFVEFRPYIGYCKFRDCKHESEPGCALIEAIEKGKISSYRLASYRHIKNTLDDHG